MKLQDLLKDIELGKVYTDKDRKPFKVNEEKLNEFNKAHFLNLIKQEVDSLKGQIAYSKDKVRYKGTPDWEKKEFKGVLKDLLKKLKDTEKHYKRDQKLKEGKLKEAKESIFDVAARVLKNKQHEKYKGVRIDLQTANLLVQVHSKVSNKMRSILTKLGDQNIKQLINTLWAIAK